MNTIPIKSFEQATSLVSEILKGTKFGGSKLEECGGGDGIEDIKPLLIDEGGEYSFMAVCFPEGGILFTITDNDDMCDEYDDLFQAIEKWDELISK